MNKIMYDNQDIAQMNQPLQMPNQFSQKDLRFTQDLDPYYQPFEMDQIGQYQADQT